MTADALGFLADTPVRAELLGVLDRVGVARPSTLRDELEVSRATVHRNLSALTERGWVRQRDAGYEVTTAGVLVHDRYESFTTAVETIERFEPLLELIPERALPPLSVLAEASLVTATSNEPHAPVMRYVEELTASETETVQGVSPVRSNMFAQGHEELLEAGVDTELVVPKAILDDIRADEDDDLQAALAIPGFEMYEVEADPGYGLAVTDDRAFVGGYDDANQLRALAVGDDDALIDWAERTYEDLRSTAAPVTA